MDPAAEQTGHTPVVPDYRRNRVPGGTFFFTANLPDRRSDLLVTQIDALRDAVRQVPARQNVSFQSIIVGYSPIRRQFAAEGAAPRVEPAG